MAQSSDPEFHPALAASNITDHPGSTYAGIGAILAVVSSSIMSTGGMPTTTAGWLVFASTVLAGIGGILGR